MVRDRGDESVQQNKIKQYMNIAYLWQYFEITASGSLQFVQNNQLTVQRRAV
jgi:hypothetical protein